jgi:hypothetical protein
VDAMLLLSRKASYTGKYLDTVLCKHCFNVFQILFHLLQVEYHAVHADLTPLKVDDPRFIMPINNDVSLISIASDDAVTMQEAKAFVQLLLPLRSV